MIKRSANMTDDSPVRDGVQELQAVLRFARVVRFRKGVLIVAVGISLLLWGLYYATAKRVYESKARLLVLQTGSDQWSNNITDNKVATGLIDTYREILGSEVVLEEAIKRIPPEVRGKWADVPADERAAMMKQNLIVREVRGTNVLDVAYRSNDLNEPAEVVNGVISAYMDFMDKLHKSTAGELLDILTREKTTLEEQLREKESELLSERSKAGDLVIRDDDNGPNVVMKRVMFLNQALIAAHEKRLQAQSWAAAVENITCNDGNLQSCALAMIDSIGNNSLLDHFGFGESDTAMIASINREMLANRSKLKFELQQYGPAHRKVRELQEQIRVAEQYLADRHKCGMGFNSAEDNEQLKELLSQVSSQQLQQAIAHENSIRASYEEEKQKAIALDRNAAALEMLQLDVQRLRGFYDVVLERMKNIDLGRENGSLRTSILSSPEVPKGHVSPRLMLGAMLALVCGLCGGLGTVYVQDLLDDRFRSAEEMQMQLGSPVLATVHKHDPIDGEGIESVLVHANPGSVEAEAFRTMRTTLTFSNENVGRLVVSSSEPGDGKTTVSSNLAVVFAQAGRRTLLIDADMRRPGLTSLLNLSSEKGLSTCLRDRSPMAESAAANLLSSVAENLDVIPAGPRPLNAMELLASERFSELLSWAEANYEQIVIDSPPAVVSDTTIIGQLVDGLVLVVQPAKNHRRTVIRTVDGFTMLGVKLLGVVANHVADDDETGYGYGYSYGYKYKYEYGYGHDEDVAIKKVQTRELVRPTRRKPLNVA